MHSFRLSTGSRLVLILRRAALAVSLAGLGACARSVVPLEAGAVAAANAPSPTIFDYRNGWYHWSAEGESISAIAHRYGRTPALVAELNKRDADKALAPKTPIYVPPVEDRDELKDIVARIAKDPDLVPRRPPDPALLAALQTQGATFETSEVADAAFSPQPKRVHRGGKSGFIWPIEGDLLREYSEDSKRPFRGVTIRAAEGSPVVASRAGKTIYAGALNGYGQMAILDHGDGYMTCYGYNQRLLVKTGDMVQAGQPVGLVGRPSAQGKSQSFFQVRRNNQPVNPMELLK